MKFKIIAILILFSLTLQAFAIQNSEIENAKQLLKENKLKDAKTLLQLLMAQDNPRFSKPITTLENALYQNGKIQLNKVKKEAVDAL